MSNSKGMKMASLEMNQSQNTSDKPLLQMREAETVQ